MAQPTIGRHAHGEEVAEPLFARVVCGFAPLPVGREAARQATLLAGPGGRIEYRSIELPGHDFAASGRALAEAVGMASAEGALASGRFLAEADPAGALAAAAGPGTLIVVADGVVGQLDGRILGGVPTRVLHAAGGPVLLAREGPAGVPFPMEILVASDGSAGSLRAATLAAAIAERHGSRVWHLHVGGSTLEQRRTMARETAALFEATGVEPVVTTASGSPAKQILAAAAERRCSLVVIGSGGHGGRRGLSSVSERVAYEAGCSVLVAGPEDE